MKEAASRRSSRWTETGMTMQEPRDSSSDEVLRVFIAIDLPDDVRARLGDFQRSLTGSGVRVSWLAPEKIHLTLVFIGHLFAARVEPLADAMDRVARTGASFECTVEGAGYFGSTHSPRVIWAGIPSPPEALMTLQARLAEAVAAQAIPLESRPFRPHITLGRVRSARGAGELTSALQSASNTHFGQVPVTRVCLMQSRLLAAGAQYTILHESALKGETDHGR